MTTPSRCPACHTGARRSGQYLCRNCWFTLTDATRRLLDRRDSRAFTRLRSLYRQLDRGVPLAEIRVTA